MIRDSDGNVLKRGDVCFYTERPYSNYADSIVVITEKDDTLYVKYLIGNGREGRYENVGDMEQDILPLSVYTWDILHQETDVASNLQLIKDLVPEDVTVELANERFPLDK